VLNSLGLRTGLTSLSAQVLRTTATAGFWLKQQALSIIDLPRWRSAASWPERGLAVSWPRVGILALILALAIALTFSILDAMRLPGPGPLPTDEEMRIRQEALSRFKATPPPGLVEANKSVPTETR
jgi:hypothetical protein